MKRLITSALTVSLLALGLGACDSQQDYGSGYGYPANVYCGQYTTCGTCTPVIGCGWCYNGDGVGTCASDPDQCTGQQFSWTWEATGCRVAADASAVPTTDAGPPNGDAAPSDAAKSDVVVPPPTDAAGEADAP